MGEDEKAQQIGRAVSEYQTAKVDCAHIEQKVKRIFDTYQAAGDSMDSRKGSGLGEARLENGKVKLAWWSPEKFSVSDLLNETDLAVVLAERDKARERLERAKKVMVSLGITGVS